MTNSLPLHRSFPPIADHRAKILILGSMPGVKSLEQQQYYAHPRNAFWPIMSALFAIDRTLDYDKRCQLLVDKQIAVWDVLQACQRQGSLDQAINSASMVTNDFNLFLQHHPDITKIVFNGAKAEHVFKRLVLPTLTEPQHTILRLLLPSTSPAHASLSFDDKLAIWRQALTG
jgi:double-stranded uracil-DNA glycosylase